MNIRFTFNRIRLDRQNQNILQRPFSAESTTGIPIINCLDYPNNENLNNNEFQKNITQALISTGCFYITNHGFEPTPLYSAATSFFALSPQQKDSIHARHEKHEPHPFVPRGYIDVGGENLNKERPCVKESFDMGNIKKNLWPDDTWIPNFRANLSRDYELLRSLNEKLLEGIATGLGIEPTRFTNLTRDAYATMRFLHYVERDLTDAETKDINEEGDIIRGGEHTDTFINTLIFSCQPGLRIRKNEDNTWHKAPIVDHGKAVLFFGADLLEVLTNGLVRAGVHQVIVDNSLLKGRHVSSRISIALFNYARFDIPIKPMPEFVSSSNPSKYDERTQETQSQGAYETKFKLKYIDKLE